jgi:hypothetical protein
MNRIALKPPKSLTNIGYLFHYMQHGSMVILASYPESHSCKYKVDKRIELGKRSD